MLRIRFVGGFPAVVLQSIAGVLVRKRADFGRNLELIGFLERIVVGATSIDLALAETVEVVVGQGVVWNH